MHHFNFKCQWHGHKCHGFSLIELSIVLIITGLIVASVSAGQSLVEQSRIRSMFSDLDKFNAAFLTFKLKYDTFPGDLSNAYDYWGANCDSTPSYCNGNGNKKIEFTSSKLDNEVVRAWQHVTLAGMLPGSYPGTSTTAGQVEVGVNAPESDYHDAGYAVAYIPSSGATSYYSTEPTSIHYFYVGKEHPTSLPFVPFISPRKLSLIDQKYDNGIPGSGRIIGKEGSGYVQGTSCTQGTDPNITYRTTVDTESCFFWYVAGF